MASGMAAPRLTEEATDSNKWITISKIAVLLVPRTAMAAEVMGACVLNEYLGLRPTQMSLRKNIHQCIDAMVRNSGWFLMVERL